MFNSSILDVQINVSSTILKQLIDKKKYIKANNVFLQISTTYSEKLPDLMRYGNWVLLIGRGLLQIKEYQKALQIFNKFMVFCKDFPDSHNALYFKCLTLYNLNEFDQALEIIKDLQKINHIPCEIFRIKGDTLFKQKKFIKAASSYVKAFFCDPNNLIYKINYGDCIVECNQYQEAKQQYDYVISQVGADKIVINLAKIHKANVLIQEKNYQDAINLLAEIIQIDENSQQAKDLHSQAIKLQNGEQQAFDKTLNLNAFGTDSDSLSTYPFK